MATKKKDPDGYTPTQRRMMAILSDGKEHSADELHGCISDELATIYAVRTHIYLLRMKLKDKSTDIVSRGGCYQLVKFL